MDFGSTWRRVIGAVAILLALVAPAFAHPHIFVDAKVVVVFDANGAP